MDTKQLAALRQIADQDPVELALDPTWAKRIAAEALAALPSDAAGAPWINVADQMPASGHTVLAAYLNSAGKSRRIRAQYIAAKTRESNGDDGDMECEYDEDADTYYWPAGWYECIDNWSDYTHVFVGEGEITHWTELPVAPGETNAAPVAPAAPINLEGLRNKLLTPREIVRDNQGFLTHPDYPICDEGTCADAFLEAFGIETRFRSMENDLPDLHERWCDEGLDDCSEWTPTPPEGDGWFLLEIYDTEDGPYAMFGRDKYEAEQARKKERTRKLRAALQSHSEGDQQ